MSIAVPAIIHVAQAKEPTHQPSENIGQLKITDPFYKACKANANYSVDCFNNPKQIELNYAEFEKQSVKLTAAQKAILKKIGGCETGFQMKPNATGVSSAYGIFQTLKIHDARAKKLGVSRFTREGNITITISLFLEQGSSPWNASKHCWAK